jgi:hypothetical protein
VNSAGEGSKVSIVIPKSGTLDMGSVTLPSQCIKLIFNKTNTEAIYYTILMHIKSFVDQKGCGIPLLVYSVLFTQGFANVEKEFDIEGTVLITQNGYAS